MRKSGMFRYFAAAAFCAVAVLAAEERPPRHDPPGQLFRWAPMAQASRSIVVNLATNLHLAFDADLCRIHTIWRGGPLNLWGPPYSHSKSPFICDFEGQTVCSFPQVPPSVSTAPGQVRYLGMSATNGFSVRYSVAGAEVSESIAGAENRGAWQITRKFSLSPNGPAFDLRVCADALGTTGKRGAIARGKNGALLFHVEGDAEWEVRSEPMNYWEERITEEGTEKGNPSTHQLGAETWLYARFPAGARAATITFGSTMEPLAASFVPEPALRTFPPAPPIRRQSGDRFYRIEHFPMPKEAELIVTGMDALPNGDLAICTWLGEVFVVRGATGAVEKAEYRRIARGLNEPLGLAVRGKAIYVAQKGELTRLTDTDEDGELDRFDCVNAGWGYSGNYHSYTFGPVILPDGDFFMFITGQRGRADLLYQGYGLRIDGRSGELTPWCDGLRVPHGFGLFRGDVFITDNQGNWIGACKLNHIQQGRFYGFPSSAPSPRGPRQAEEVAPPALWFPRALSPSTSGFAEVLDDRFGPFRGQMMIGDFQNAIVMRACLEKVNGQWQGAVFPFAKGFLSGVNRLVMNLDGKLYVGGGKRTWSTAAPSEFSLERVSFTGQIPFEVKTAKARANGFELSFAKPLDPETAKDPESYLVKQFTYEYHEEYGSPEFDHDGKPGNTTLKVRTAQLSEDGLSVALEIEGLQAGYVTSIQAAVSSADGEELRNDTLYYTLNEMPKQSSP